MYGVLSGLALISFSQPILTSTQILASPYPTSGLSLCSPIPCTFTEHFLPGLLKWPSVNTGVLLSRGFCNLQITTCPVDSHIDCCCIPERGHTSWDVPSTDSGRKKRLAGCRTFPEPVRASWKICAPEGKAVHPGFP